MKCCTQLLRSLSASAATSAADDLAAVSYRPLAAPLRPKLAAAYVTQNTGRTPLTAQLSSANASCTVKREAGSHTASASHTPRCASCKGDGPNQQPLRRGGLTRQAAQALIYEIRNLKRWPADAPANADSCWADVSGAGSAPERRPGRAREHPAGGTRRTEAEHTTSSTHRLPLARGAPGALRLPGTGRGLGRRAARGPGVRSTAQRGIVRGRGAAGRARKWGARAAKLAAPHPGRAERRRRLEQCAISLERVVAAPPLATVSQRFVADAVAAA